MFVIKYKIQHKFFAWIGRMWIRINTDTSDLLSHFFSGTNRYVYIIHNVLYNIFYDVQGKQLTWLRL